MDSKTKKLLTENAKFAWGETNANEYMLDSYLVAEEFPWDRFYLDMGFDEDFPQVLYVSDDAEELYSEVSELITAIVSSSNTSIAVKLTYPDAGLGSLSVKFKTDEHTKIKGVPDLRPYLSWAAARWFANRFTDAMEIRCENASTYTMQKIAE